VQVKLVLQTDSSYDARYLQYLNNSIIATINGHDIMDGSDVKRVLVR